MYAVVKTGGKQYKVSQGDMIKVERLEGEVGSQISLNDVYLVKDGNEMVVRTPTVAGARVSCEIMRHDRARKIIVFKMKRRKNYRRKRGHRQHYTTLKVKEIAYGS